MTNLALVTIPAIVAALGSILSAYVAGKVRQIAQQTNGRLAELENEIRLARLQLDEAERYAAGRSSGAMRPPIPSNDS